MAEIFYDSEKILEAGTVFYCMESAAPTVVDIHYFDNPEEAIEAAKREWKGFTKWERKTDRVWNYKIIVTETITWEDFYPMDYWGFDGAFDSSEDA